MRQSFGEELLTGWFLAFLVGASLAVAVPAGMRAKRNSPFPSAQLFKKRMNMMAPRSRGGRWVVVPDNHSGVQTRYLARRSRRRRVRIMTLLVVAALATGVWALVGSGAAVSIHLAIDLVAVFYGYLMYESNRRRTEQVRKVRSLDSFPLAAPVGAWPGMSDESFEVRDDEPLLLDDPIAL